MEGPTRDPRNCCRAAFATSSQVLQFCDCSLSAAVFRLQSFDCSFASAVFRLQFFVCTSLPHFGNRTPGPFLAWPACDTLRLRTCLYLSLALCGHFHFAVYKDFFEFCAKNEAVRFLAVLSRGKCATGCESYRTAVTSRPFACFLEFLFQIFCFSCPFFLLVRASGRQLSISAISAI